MKTKLANKLQFSIITDPSSSLIAEVQLYAANPRCHVWSTCTILGICRLMNGVDVFVDMPKDADRLIVRKVATKHKMC